MIKMTLTKGFNTREGFTTSPADVVDMAIKAGVSFDSIDSIIIAMIDPNRLGEIGAEGFSVVAESME